MHNRSLSIVYSLLACIATLLVVSCDGGDKTQPKVSYTSDIVPILEQHCLDCHLPDTPGQLASGLDMSSYESLMKGTRFGPVIKAGDSLSSTLVILVEGRADPSIKMPHGDRPSLSAAEIKTLRQWIDQGAAKN